MARNLLPALVILLCTSVALAKFSYPTVRRSNTERKMEWGAKYLDPYDWLEAPDSAETKEFVVNQNALTQNYISDVPEKSKIMTSFQKLYNYTRYSIPVKHGDWYYMTVNSGLQNQGVIYRMKTLTETESEIFIDPNNFSSDGTTSLVFTNFSPNGEFVSVGTSKGGSDWITIGVYDAKTSPPTKLPDTLKKVKFAYTGWTKNNKGFFYAYFDQYTGEGEGTDTVIPEFQKLFYHKLGNQQEDDIQIFEYKEKPKLLIGTPIISQDGKQIHLFPTEGTSNTPWLVIPFDEENIVQKTYEYKWIVKEPNAEYFYVHQDDNCTYVRTNYQAANFRLVCVDVNNPSPDKWKTIIKDHPEWVLSDTVVVNSNDSMANLVAVYMVDVVNMIQIYDLNLKNQTATYRFDVDTPIGTIQSIGGKRNGTEFFYKVATFLSPGIIYHYNFAVHPNKIKVYRESTILGLNPNDFETKQIKYKSKDGTLVPMFLVYRKTLVKDGKNPAMLYAYGGFNINIQPNYDVLGMFFVKHFNGVYAVANIRGGGEYGNVWHEAGMKLKKQNVFDDFNYAGKWLTTNGYSSRDYITINGRSNGGLLVGACSNQFGETFGAGLANVGVMDMVRFPLFTIGYAWTEEYGDPQKNQIDYENVMKYSPLHSIPNNATYRYPNMLVLTADHDDRVVPAHSYKYIAELQNTLGDKRPDTPLMIRIDSNSGHGSGKPITKWIEENTDITLFLLKSMSGRYTFKP